MPGICANDFLSVLAYLEQWRGREGSACVFFRGVNEEGRRREQRAFPISVSSVGDWKLAAES